MLQEKSQNSARQKVILFQEKSRNFTWQKVVMLQDKSQNVTRKKVKINVRKCNVRKKLNFTTQKVMLPRKV